MAFFNKLLSIGLDEKKTAEVINTYGWTYGIVLFNGETWGKFEKESYSSYLRDYNTVSQMKKDSKLKEKDFIYLFVDWESVLSDFVQTPTGASVLDDYDANDYNTEEDIEDFYNQLTPQVQQQIVALLKLNSNVKTFLFNEIS